MGIKDLARLHPVYREVVQLSKDYNWPFVWKVDDGFHETSIIFSYESNYSARPDETQNFENVKYPYTLRSPDILDFANRIIIEYEEEPKPGKKGGKLGKKGHTEESKRDSTRDELYKNAGYRLFKIWDSEYKDGSYRPKLVKFLSDCFTNRI